MKKIILLISLFIIVKSVNAETIYGEYYKVDSLNNEPLDEIKIDNIKLYNTYNLTYKDLGYLEENNKYIKNEEDYIEKEIVSNNENSIEYIEVKSSLETKNTFIMNNITKGLKIYELEIYNKNEKINYTFTYNEQFLELHPEVINIFDNSLNTSYITKSKMNLSLKLNGVYNLKDLKMIIYTEQNNSASFEFKFNDIIPLNLSLHKKHIITFTNEETVEDITYTYKEYQKLYRYYEEQKLKKDIYIMEGENLILDDYKIIEDYYKREKLILKDNLIINTNDFNVNSFIEYSSNNVITNCNINYTKNGIYKCNFILNDINIEKDILVNIDDNNYIMSNINLNKEIDNDIKHQTTKKNSNKKLNVKKTHPKQLTTKIIKLKQVGDKSEIKRKNNKYKKNLIKIIILIILIILEIIIIYKKRKRDNVEYI